MTWRYIALFCCTTFTLQDFQLIKDNSDSQCVCLCLCGRDNATLQNFLTEPPSDNLCSRLPLNYLCHLFIQTYVQTLGKLASASLLHSRFTSHHTMLAHLPTPALCPCSTVVSSAWSPSAVLYNESLFMYFCTHAVLCKSI